MVPGHVEGRYSAAELQIDLGRLCASTGAEFVKATVTGIDPGERLVRLLGRAPRPYDFCSLNLGGSPALGAVPGAAKFAVPVKPVPMLLAGIGALARDAERLPQGEGVRLVVVGGGAGGVELVLALERRLGRRLRVTIISKDGELLAGHAPLARRKLTATCQSRGIVVKLGRRVVEVFAGAVKTHDGASVPFDYLLWATPVVPEPWLAESGLMTTAAGYVRVTPALQSVSHPNIFAAGDLAMIDGAPRPRSGVFAVRAAAPLARNLANALAGLPLEPYVPQQDFLSLIGTADGRALASRGGFVLYGRTMAWLKDRIDRRFMAQFPTGEP